MIDKVLRLPKEKVLEPIAKGPLKRINPNVITLSACAVSLAAGAAAWRNANGIALGLWLLNRLLDGLDGTTARVNNKQSDFGGYLDIVLDMVAYVTIPIGLALAVNKTNVYIALIFLFASFYINSAAWMMLAAYLEKFKQGARINGELTSVTMPTSIIEGAEAVLFYSIFLLFPQHLETWFYLLAFLVFLSAGKQVFWAFKHMHNGKRDVL
jgi:phosphatidylglycerophosphate synthase